MNDCFVNSNAGPEFDESMYKKGYVKKEYKDKEANELRKKLTTLNEEVAELTQRLKLYENILKKIKLQNEEINKTIFLFTAGR